MRRVAVAAALVIVISGCEDDAPTSSADPMAACRVHADCRVIAGVCDSPTPVNLAHLVEMERIVEVRGRHRSCRDPGVTVEDTTAACVRGSCAALLGPPDEHACESDADCVVTRGLCGPTEAVARDAEEAFGARVEELERRHIRCGYGRVDTSIRAACDDGLCVPASRSE